MELVKEVYYDEATRVLSKIEIKHIFINLLDIIAFEKEFVCLLEAACSEGDPDVTIGIAFSMIVSSLLLLFIVFLLNVFLHRCIEWIKYMVIIVKNTKMQFVKFKN